MKYAQESPPFKTFLSLGLLALVTVAAPARAADPEYTFRLMEDHQPDLCAHMDGVFNQYFRHMWAEAEMKDPLDLDTIYSEKSIYAFPLLPGTKHDTRATLEMRFTKVPSSPEFEAIQWHEGHAKAMPIAAPGKNLAYVPPFLVAYVDIDNNGTVDTVYKIQFTNYSSLFAKGGEGSVEGESLVTYRDKRVDDVAPDSVSNLIDNSDIPHGPSLLNGDQLRLFAYQGKTYLAVYDQGFDDPPSKHTRANLKRNVPPHETMTVQSLSYKGLIDPIGRPAWTVTRLCQFDMIQTR